MEYLAGSLVTLITIYIISGLIRKSSYSSKPIKVLVSQSRQLELIQQYYDKIDNKKINTQSLNHLMKNSIKTLIIGNVAYWIENSSVYQASHVHGQILKETKKVVDMMTMDKVELDRMIFIVDKLTKG